MGQDPKGGAGGRGGFLGTLKDALAAASRDDTGKPAVEEAAVEAAPVAAPIQLPPPVPQAAPPVAANDPAAPQPARREAGAGLSAAEAAREARTAPATPATDRHREVDQPPTTRVVRAASASKPEDPARTQLVRGKPQVKRGEFQRDPVVGWLVIVGGPGIGEFRPIFEGNNTIGRSPSQRIPLDFGDPSISSEEQAYIRYDSADRSFLFVPNLAKTNVVSVNSKRPTGAVELESMDVIQVGQTQIVFVPFCGRDFDWSELTDKKD